MMSDLLKTQVKIGLNGEVETIVQAIKFYQSFESLLLVSNSKPIKLTIDNMTITEVEFAGKKLPNSEPFPSDQLLQKVLEYLAIQSASA